MDDVPAAKARQLEREARALRANLRRRKQQAQARAETAVAADRAADDAPAETDHPFEQSAGEQ